VASRGRRKGAPTVGFPLRLRVEQKLDLEFLRQVIDGSPPINGLIQHAVDRYIALKLEDPAIRAAYERRTNPHLRVVRDLPRSPS
jgi:hypothetical protein